MEVKKTKGERKPKNYLNNADMLRELKLSKEKGRLTEEMGNMFLMLTKRYASIPRFSGYSYNEDMQSVALLTLAKVWKGFDETRFNNPFAYFTQIVHNAFHQFNNQERRERDIRDSMLVAQGKNPSFGYSERKSWMDDVTDSFGDNDYMEHHDADKPEVSNIDENVQNDEDFKEFTREQPQDGEVNTEDTPPPETDEIE